MTEQQAGSRFLFDGPHGRLLGHRQAGADASLAVIGIMEEVIVGEGGDRHDEGSQGALSGVGSAGPRPVEVSILSTFAHASAWEAGRACADRTVQDPGARHLRVLDQHPCHRLLGDNFTNSVDCSGVWCWWICASRHSGSTDGTEYRAFGVLDATEPGAEYYAPR